MSTTRNESSATEKENDTRWKFGSTQGNGKRSHKIGILKFIKKNFKYNYLFGTKIISMYLGIDNKHRDKLYEKNSTKASKETMKIYCFKFISPNVKMYNIL